MKKVDVSLKVIIVEDYLRGMKYRDIMSKYQISRWNIQDALSHFNIKTNRIKSPPRFPGSKKKKSPLASVFSPSVIAHELKKRYHDIDLLPPIKVNKNNPVLEGDRDIMERMDDTEDANDLTERGFSEIVIDENNKVRYEKNV